MSIMATVQEAPNNIIKADNNKKANNMLLNEVSYDELSDLGSQAGSKHGDDY